MTAPAGWYPNPLTPGQQRYWDGTGWTEHVSPLPPPWTPELREPRARRQRFRFTRRWIIALVITAGAIGGLFTWAEIDIHRQDARRNRCIDQGIRAAGVTRGDVNVTPSQVTQMSIVIDHCDTLYPHP